MNRFCVTKIVTLVVLAVIAGTKVSASEIYHWVDENGVQHFSQYKPAGDIPNVSQQKMEDAVPPGDGEDVYNVEEHEKRMAAWREEREQKRKDAQEQKRLEAQRQPIRYQEPARNYVRPYWYPPIHNRPPHRPPHKPTPPIEKPGPPSSVRPRGDSN